MTLIKGGGAGKEFLWQPLKEEEITTLSLFYCAVIMFMYQLSPIGCMFLQPHIPHRLPKKSDFPKVAAKTSPIRGVLQCKLAIPRRGGK